MNAPFPAGEREEKGKEKGTRVASLVDLASGIVQWAAASD